MIRTLRVGALIQPVSGSCKKVRFEPLPNHGAVVCAIRADRQFGRGILYPAVEEDRPKTDPVRQKPGQMVQVLEGWFRYEPTHRLTWQRPVSQRHAAFTTVTLGFLLGMRLMPEGWGSLGRTAVAEGTWGDFVVFWRKEAEPLLDAIETSWRKRQASGTHQQLYAAINAYQKSFHYEHDFERIIFLNMALDRAYFAMSECDPYKKFGVDTIALQTLKKLELQPTRWFVKRKQERPSRHAEIRNQLLHWGHFARQPVGFAAIDHEYYLQLRNLVSRAIVAALGIRCRYTSTSLDTRQRIALDLC